MKDHASLKVRIGPANEMYLCMGTSVIKLAWRPLRESIQGP